MSPNGRTSVPKIGCREESEFICSGDCHSLEHTHQIFHALPTAHRACVGRENALVRLHPSFLCTSPSERCGLLGIWSALHAKIRDFWPEVVWVRHQSSARRFWETTGA